MANRWVSSALAARTARRAMAAGGAVILAASSLGVAAAKPAPAPTASVFDQPTAVAVAHGRVWVANAGSDSVVELATTGRVLHVFKAATYQFDSPDAITIIAGKVFVASTHAITELSASNGKLIRVISARQDDLNQPVAMTTTHNALWVVDRGSDALTRIRVSDGSLYSVVSNAGNSGCQLNDPVAVAFGHGDAWVVSPNGVVSEIGTKSGRCKHNIKAPRYGFASPQGIAYDGHHLWVSDSATDAVTELSGTGAFLQIISNQSPDANYGFNAPSVVVAHHGHIYVISPPGASPMITKVNTTTSKGNWYECNTNTPHPDFDNPTGIAIAHGRVWVASPANNSLEELNDAGGALIHHFA